MKGTWMIWIPNNKIPEKLHGNTTSPKKFDGKFWQCGNQKQNWKNLKKKITNLEIVKNLEKFAKFFKP